mmetsp:Transcript_55068/g.159461  ORF Transcript_55068/g.159461 Transcript_55068/m.159461 type:complete len:280 (+) Transcript_55068:87-926(+)
MHISRSTNRLACRPLRSGRGSSAPDVLVATVIGANRRLNIWACGTIRALPNLGHLHLCGLADAAGGQIAIDAPTVYSLLHVPQEGAHLAKVGRGIPLDNVVVTSVLRKIAGPTAVLRCSVRQTKAVVQGNDIVHATMHHEDRAVHRLDVLVVPEEVKAAEHTRGPATRVGLRINDTDAGQHGRVQYTATHWSSSCQGHRGSTADALAVNNDALGGDTAAKEKVVRRLGICERVASAGLARGCPVTGVLDTDDLATELSRHLEVRGHHHADVRRVAMAMQ